MLPEHPDLSELENLAGDSLSRLLFARDGEAASAILPGTDYVVVCARHLRGLTEAEALALRGQSDACWVLLRSENDGVLPPWTQRLDFAHQLGPAPVTSSPRAPEAEHSPHVLRVGTLALNTRSGELRAGAHTVQLTPRECRLLAVFLSRPNEVLKKEELMEGCWGETNHHINLVQVTIRRLRQKLATQAGLPDLIENCRGFGYKLNV
jgi:two-component system alkaline phosphatase synthesis response regulator PhoP